MPIIGPVISAATSWRFVAFVVIVIIGLCVEAVIPRYRYDEAQGSIWHRLQRNITVGFVYLLIVGPLAIAPLLLAASEVSVWQRPAFMHSPLFLIIDIVIFDFVNYALHYAFHYTPYLWRYHMVHHLDQHLDVSTSFRAHFVELAAYSMGVAAVVLVFATPFSSVLIWQTIIAFIGIYQHNNLGIGRHFEDSAGVGRRVERLISRVFATRMFHDIHHARAMRYTNSNYAFVLTIWDYIFHTYSTMDRPDGYSSGLDDHGDYSATALLLNPILRRGKPFVRPEQEFGDQSTAA